MTTNLGFEEETYKKVTKRYKTVVPYTEVGYAVGVKLNCPSCGKVMGTHSSDHEVMYREGVPISISGFRCSNCGNTKPAWDIVSVETGEPVSLDQILYQEPEPEPLVIDDKEEFEAEIKRAELARQQATARRVEEELINSGGEPVLEDVTEKLKTQLTLKGKTEFYQEKSDDSNS